MSTVRPLRPALAALFSAALLAQPALAAPASVSADLSAQTGHHTGAASLDAAVVVRRGSFLRAGLRFDASGTCDRPAMLLTDVASGTAVRMPFVSRDEGAALARLTSDALARSAQRRCVASGGADCVEKANDAASGATLFGATLAAKAFGTSVATSADGTYALVTPWAAASPLPKNPIFAKIAEALRTAALSSDTAKRRGLTAEQYAELAAQAGSPFYTVVVERTYDPEAGEVRAALAVWLPEDLPIGAFTLSLGCGDQPVGDGLPLVVLFNPYDATTVERAPASVAATVQQGRADLIATPGLASGFSLSPPDQAAIDTLLELIADFPLSARRHPALVARIAAKGRGPIQLTGRANYAKKGGYDSDFGAGETNADLSLWASAKAWNDATGHFDLWDGELGKVGDGAWPYAGAARLRVRKGEDSFAQGDFNANYRVKASGSQLLAAETMGHALHILGDSFAAGHTLRMVPPGAVTPGEAVYADVARLLGGMGEQVEITRITEKKAGLRVQVRVSGELKETDDVKVVVKGGKGGHSNVKFDFLDAYGKASGTSFAHCALKPAPASAKSGAGGVKYGQCWVFSAVLQSAHKAGGPTPNKGPLYGGSPWSQGVGAKAAGKKGGPKANSGTIYQGSPWSQGGLAKKGGPTSNNGPLYQGSPWSYGARAFLDGTDAYTTTPYAGAQRTPNGVVPRASGLWVWTSGAGTGSAKKGGGDKLTGPPIIFDGTAYRVVGGWSFDDSAAQDSSGRMAMSAGFDVPAVGDFTDSWKGEAVFMAADFGSSGVRISATSGSGKPVDPLAGITFVAPSSRGATVDGVKVCVASAKEGGEPTCKTGSLADTGSVFRAHRGGGRGFCHYGKCFCLSGTSEGLLRAAGIPTRSVTNFDSAHEKSGFQIPGGVGPSNGFLVRTTPKAEPLQPWYDFAPYAAYIVGKGGSKESIWNFHVWNQAALEKHGESIWNFHVWTEAWVPSAGGKTAGWNAYDSTAQETSDGKAQGPGAAHGLSCPAKSSAESCAKSEAVQAAAKATGVSVSVLADVLSKPRNTPSELLHGRWDGQYDDGKEPGTWTGAAKPTPKPDSGEAASAPSKPTEESAAQAAKPAKAEAAKVEATL